MDRRLLGALVVALTAALSAAPAQSATLVQGGSCSKTPTAGPFGQSLQAVTDRCGVTFDKFDSGLGSLNSVQLLIVGGTSYFHTLTGHNPTGTDQTFTLRQRYTEYTLAVEDVSTVPGSIFLLSLGPFVGQILTQAPGGEATVDLGTLGSTFSDNAYNYFGAAMGGFTGAGTFELALNVYDEFLVTFTDLAMSYDRSSEMDVEFVVTYNYAPAVDPEPPTPVPEPATWSLMIAGFGLAGAGLRRRRCFALRVT